MKRKDGDTETLDLKRAEDLLEEQWQNVVAEASEKPDIEYVSDATLRREIHDSINHKQVAYRFCLPIQLLGRDSKYVRIDSIFINLSLNLL
jgi:hypothetical protein